MALHAQQSYASRLSGRLRFTRSNSALRSLGSGADDAEGDFVLRSEQVVEFALEAIGPHLDAAHSIDKFGGDAYTFA